MTNHGRRGMLAAGNFIVDRVKRIDAYPAENLLANIHDETRSNGGGPYNLLKDLAALGAGYPLMAAGLVGDDADGEWIRRDCGAHGIDPSRLEVQAGEATSYTDVMTVESTGRRTFFHRRGANARFTGDRLEFGGCGARHFHLAYLMLLDELDGFAADGRTRAAHLLERASSAGLVTSVDVVSTDHPRFAEVVRSALPHADHLLINEAEACRVLGQPLDPADAAGLTQAARQLMLGGVRTAVVLHTEHGAVAVTADGRSHQQGAVALPDGWIQGANGAGDAFAAGYLHSLHEDRPVGEALALGVCAAAACLAHPSPSAGLMPAAECLALGQRFGFGNFR